MDAHAHLDASEVARRANHQIDSYYQNCCQALSRKIFRLRFSEIYVSLCHPDSGSEGRLANRRRRGAGCGGRVGVARRATSRRTAKSCGPGSPTLESSFTGGARETTEANKPGTPR